MQRVAPARLSTELTMPSEDTGDSEARLVARVPQAPPAFAELNRCYLNPAYVYHRRGPGGRGGAEVTTSQLFLGFLAMLRPQDAPPTPSPQHHQPGQKPLPGIGTACPLRRLLVGLNRSIQITPGKRATPLYAARSQSAPRYRRSSLRNAAHLPAVRTAHPPTLASGTLLHPPGQLP